jgi:hypothetical protein
MKSKVLFLFLVFAQIGSAQNFTEVTGTPFAGVQESSIAFADVDGDNDQDVLITGVNLVQPGTPGDRISKLYTNDGLGNFTEVMGTPFEGVEYGSIAFADVDGDNDQDVLITGRSDAGFSSKLYTNDGLGNFTEVMGTPFQGVSESSIAFADVDGDNDQDVLITGHEVASPVYIPMLDCISMTDSAILPKCQIRLLTAFVMPRSPLRMWTATTTRMCSLRAHRPMALLISKLYTNDGSGNFTEVMGTPFVGVAYGAIAFADVDGDDDQDVFITGHDGSFSGSLKTVYQ